MKLFLLTALLGSCGGLYLQAQAKPVPEPHTHRAVPHHVINLDLPPEERYNALVPEFNATVWKFWETYFAHDQAVVDALFLLSDARGHENDEQQREIEGLANASKLPLKFVQAIQMLYELNTLMVPIENLTAYSGENAAVWDPIPSEWSALSRLPFRGPGCTGIIANNTQDGTVYHVRNLDFSPPEIMDELVFDASFQRGGEEVFRSQMIAGYTMVITAMRAGPDGYAIERNTRYTNHAGGNAEMFDHLLTDKRPLNGWTLRKILETNATYDEAVSSIEASDYVSTEYAIVSGVQKGRIISKDPNDVHFVQVLGQSNPEEPDDYIIMTNFDFYDHDIRETFDKTGGHLGHPTRRETAQIILNASIPTGLTQDVLFDTIDARGVIADTVFQAVINVEKGIWNLSIPNYGNQTAV